MIFALAPNTPGIIIVTYRAITLLLAEARRAPACRRRHRKRPANYDAIAQNGSKMPGQFRHEI